MHNLQLPFQKLVELIHVNVDEKLRREVAKRQTDVCSSWCVETINDFMHKPHCIGIFDTLPQDVFENLVVNAREKFSDVAF